MTGTKHNKCWCFRRNNGSLSAKETREQDLTMSKGSESLPRLEESSSDSEKDYELDDFDIIKTIGKFSAKDFLWILEMQFHGSLG